MDLAPRIWIEASAPGSPVDDIMSIPAMRPWSAELTEEAGTSASDFMSTTETAPVRSDFLDVP